jgi:hypothetical protein
MAELAEKEMKEMKETLYELNTEYEAMLYNRRDKVNCLIYLLQRGEPCDKVEISILRISIAKYDERIEERCLIIKIEVEKQKLYQQSHKVRVSVPYNSAPDSSENAKVKVIHSAMSYRDLVEDDTRHASNFYECLGTNEE